MQSSSSSPAISKQHAAIMLREGKVFLKDYGSTNGSFVNGEQVVDEREVKHDDKLKIGPLEFMLRVDASSPTAAKPTAAKPSGIKTPPKPATAPTPANATATSQPASPPAPATLATPKPAAPKPGAAKPVAAKPSAVKPPAGPATSTPAPVAVTATPLPVPAPAETVAVSVPVDTSETVADDQSDQLAAMLLMEEAAAGTEGTAEQSIPDGTTVLEIPAVPEDPKKAADMLQKVKEASKNNSQAAGDLLRKYMNRPRTQ